MAYGCGACLDTEPQRGRVLHAAVGAAASVLVTLAILPGCKVQGEIRAAHDPAADFASYRSFNFVPMAGLRSGSSARVANQVRRAIVRELQQRGYVLEPYYPNLLVNFGDNMAREVTADEYYCYRYYGAWKGYENWDEIEAVHYPPGTLSVDLIDASRMQMIWEGVAVGEIGTQRSDVRDAEVPRTITKLFERFPLRASGQAP